MLIIILRNYKADSREESVFQGSNSSSTEVLACTEWAQSYHPKHLPPASPKLGFLGLLGFTQPVCAVCVISKSFRKSLLIKRRSTNYYIRVT